MYPSTCVFFTNEKESTRQKHHLYIFIPITIFGGFCTFLFVGFLNGARGSPKSSIFIGFSIIHHSFWGSPISGNLHFFGGCYISRTSKKPTSKRRPLRRRWRKLGHQPRCRVVPPSSLTMVDGCNQTDQTGHYLGFTNQLWGLALLLHDKKKHMKMDPRNYMNGMKLESMSFSWTHPRRPG